MKSNHKYELPTRQKPFWGPSIPPPFAVAPNYQEYSKTEKIGKIADWISPQEKRGLHKISNQSATNSIYTCYQEEEDDFTSISHQRSVRTPQSRRPKFNVPRTRGTSQRGRGYTNFRGGRGKTRGYINRGRYGDRFYNSNYWFRKPSVLVRETWKLIRELDYQKLLRMRVATEPTATDIYSAGAVMAYDRAYDYVRVRDSRPLKASNHVFHKVPTCDDPIIRENTNRARVFASDSILCALMTGTRAVAPWDILVHRVADLLFLDKRPDAELEMLTVSETASDPLFDQQLNSPMALALEATSINQNYSQQCLLQGSLKQMPNKNPFFQGTTASMPSVAYKYRVFDLAGLKLLVRCEFDAYNAADGGCVQVKSLLEWGTKATMFGWRDELETLGGAVLATEIKNNSCKFARWAAQAVLLGGSTLKLGFVSRNNYASNKEHSILGSVSVASSDLVAQIGFKLDNAWGIVHQLCTSLLELPEGKYILMKDPQKAAIRLYNVPDSNINSEDEAENETADTAKNMGDKFGLDDIY